MSKLILCADDSATMQTVAEITFRASDFRCVGVRSADEALRLARENRPALILADALMPGKTGYDLCQAVKSDPELRSIPVVLMCGNSQAFDASRGKQVGADGHVSKPWDTQQMLDKVGELLARFESEGVAQASADGAAARPAAAAAPAVPAVPAAAATTPARPPASPNLQPRAKTPVPQMPPRPAPPPAHASTPPPSKPAAVAAAAPPPRPIEPPRSMTLMGMPTLKMPPGSGGSVTTMPTATQQATAPTAEVEFGKPMDGLSRPPMIEGAPTKRLSFAAYARKASPDELAAARAEAGRVAGELGYTLSDVEAAAILKLSREVVERIVWEAVPDLAEVIIRENLDKLAAK